MSPSKTEIIELTRALRTAAKHIGIACFCLYALACHAQTPVLNNVVSPSPNASALAAYVETSTNLYTGVPSITVPVHTITSKKLSWPIVLSYHAAGIKVNEVGGIVGLGWSLEGANAVVTRAMRGLPDEQDNGYFEYATTVPDENATIDLSLKVDMAEGLVDMIPDVFYYNTGMSGGKILFDNQLIPRTIPRNDVKITTGSQLSSFTLVEPDGTIFQFADHETSSTLVKGPDPAPFKSTWYLTRIISADRSDTIKFNYTTYSYQYVTNEQSMLKYYTNVPGGAAKVSHQIDHETTTSLTSIANAKLLTSIEYHGGKLEFLSSNRNDDGSKKIDAIVVYYRDPFTKAYVEEKRINFTYGYFYNAAGTGQPAYRLRLDNIQEQTSGEYLPPYEFIYSSKILPLKTSFGQDHWGYANGSNGNTSLIPSRQDGNWVLSYNNREISTAFNDAGMLNKIITPLEGVFEYVFEPNEYLNGTTNAIGPGLRIKKIIKRDPFSNINAITNYEYKRPSDGLSSGKLIDNPQYDAGMTVSDYTSGSGQTYDCWLVYARPMGVGNFSDSPVLYEYVTTYQGDALTVAGKTLSKFSVYSPGYTSYPYSPEEDDSWTAGRLISQELFKVEGTTETTVSKTLNTFAIHAQTAQVKGLKVGYNKILINATATANDFDIENYFTYSKYQYLEESRNYTYEENSGTITSEQVRNYYYDTELDYTMPVKIRTNTSETGISVQEEFLYPRDFTTGVFATMNSLNMIAMPVESRTFSIGTSDYLIGCSKTEFLDWGTNNVYPQFTYGPKLGSPILRSTFDSSPASYLQKSVNLLKYSESGRPLETKVENGQSQAVIIDSYHQQPIASCSPATYNQIAYTGFETPYRGEWTATQDWTLSNLSTEAKTGLKSLNLQTGYSITKSNLPAGNYIVTYYQKDGTVTVSASGGGQVTGTETSTAEADGWQLIRKTISIANTTDVIQLTATSCKIDELRLQPEGSFMNTVSYDVRGRTTTQTDQNVRSSYVEYDIWSRLKLVRDHDRGIVKQYEYHMSGN